jgi:hypothetical protein
MSFLFEAMNRKTLFDILKSSSQGFLAGSFVGLIGQSALPLLLLSIPLDRSAVKHVKAARNFKNISNRDGFFMGYLALVGINAVFSAFGLSVVAPVSPFSNDVRHGYYSTVATPTTAKNANDLSHKIDTLLTFPNSLWMTVSQKSKLEAKRKTISSVLQIGLNDKAIYSEGLAIMRKPVNDSSFTSILERAKLLASDKRSGLALTEQVKEGVAIKAREALHFAQTKELIRLSRLPKKYSATMKNCFVDAPCETYDRVAIVADGKVTVGDTTCSTSGNDSGCSVSMSNGQPLSMKVWDPSDGFVLTTVVFGGRVKDGTYDPEKEANPYVKIENARVERMLQDWEHEKENARTNCKGLQGVSWTYCAGAQTAN